MAADTETVTADQPAVFPATRADAAAAWAEFLPRVPAYDAARNDVRPGHRAVSRLSPVIRRRLLVEHELVADTLAAHPLGAVEKFVQELLWRRYWKSWLELRPAVWTDYRDAIPRLRADLRGYQAKRVADVEAGRSGVQIMDYFADELRSTGYLHNHARMWFAGFWVHTERLPWQLGADFFDRHLLDADPASNTLSWRWVAGIQTRGKPYLTRRSNLERYVAADLLAAHGGGLDKLDDDAAQLAPVDAPDLPPPVWPDDADDVALPDGLPDRVGLWVHDDDLSPETSPVADVRPAAVFATDSAAAIDGTPRRDYARAAVADGLTLAADRFAAEPTAGDLPGLPAWAAANRLGAVVAVRPSVGPTWAMLPKLRARLASAGVALHLLWRPADVRTLPWAESGYFNFWRDARADLLGERGESAKDARRRKLLRRRGR